MIGDMDRPDERIGELRAAYLFVEVPEETLAALLRSARDVTLCTDETLFTQGERAPLRRMWRSNRRRHHPAPGARRRIGGGPRTGCRGDEMMRPMRGSAPLT